MRTIALLFCAAAAGLAPLGASAEPVSPPPAADVTAEQRIRDVNTRWLELIRTGNAEGVAELYVENGALMPPNAPIAVGRSAIAEGWRSMMATPGFGLTFEPTEIVVSAAGDMAYDRGTYRFTATPPSGAISDIGKYLVVWQKVGGEWKVAADIFNSDKAP